MESFKIYCIIINFNRIIGVINKKEVIKTYDVTRGDNRIHIVSLLF